jgi:HSP20 family protein
MKLSDRITLHTWPQEFENVLDHWLGQRAGGERCTGYCPATNLVEKDQQFVITMELPGVDVSDVSVETSDDQLVVAGEKKVVFDSETEKALACERVTGSFRRTFEFPTQVDFEQISATFKHGVLSVIVPKSEKVLPRQIQIEVAE